MPTKQTPLQLKRIRVANIKCFGSDGVDIAFQPSESSPSWTLILGDNAVGKTAILRCIAMGLCDESSAAGLMKESDEGYTRRSSNMHGKISIDLWDSSAPNAEYNVTTTIERVQINGSDLFFERLRQQTVPATRFPWDRVFACAYGIGRGNGGTGDIAGYSVINSVYNLFNYEEGLQNPELTIKRVAVKKQQQEWLNQIGKAFEETPTALSLKDRGIAISGRWGDDMPLRDLADGIRATFLWVADFIGWALAFDSTFGRTEDITGIVLVDEIEEHLHATWQRRIVNRLRDMFPRVQFIVTTHSPIVAGSVGPMPFDIDDPAIVRSANDQVWYLERGQTGDVSAVKMESMRLMRVDQILASRAFKYLIDEDPAVETVLKRASMLAAKGDRSPGEEQLYSVLLKGLRDLLIVDGQTLIERRLELTSDMEQRKRIAELEKQVSAAEK